MPNVFPLIIRYLGYKLPKRKKQKKEKITIKKDKLADDDVLHTQHIQIEMEPMTDIAAKVRTLIFVFFFRLLAVVRCFVLDKAF